MTETLSVSSEIPDPPAVPETDAGATPVIAQYLAVKREHPGHLLFFRMGDFYELFFEDAACAAQALDIVLTRRGKHKGVDIPMCGVPVHAVDGYLARLIRKGFKVAICEQIEDPAEARRRGSKAVVMRDVVRLITPGTLSEDTLLEPDRHNYLAALARTGGKADACYALAWLDMSTGDCHVGATALDRLGSDLARIRPGEILYPETLSAEPGLQALLREAVEALTPLPAQNFDSAAGERRLKDTYGVLTAEGFAEFARAELGALGALLSYVALTQKGHAPRLRPPQRVREGAHLLIDAATRANLELAQNLAGERRGGLLHCIDRTRTAAGARLLAERLLSPLTDELEIARRLDAVELFFDDEPLSAHVRDLLARVPDIARALQRLALDRGGPRDLAAIAEGLGTAQAFTAAFGEARRFPGLAPEIAEALAALTGFGDLVTELKAALADSLPVQVSDGGFVRAGYEAALDELRTLSAESRRVILLLEARLREKTGINLKIKHNNQLGYFVETAPAHGEKLLKPPHAAEFIHRQTLVSAVRFTTAELAELEQKIARAGAQALDLETEIFRRLRTEVLSRAEPIGRAAQALAVLDVASALGTLARERRWTRPLVDQSLAFRIKGGRHPVVEAALLRAGAAAFVPNDCDLSGGGESGRLWLVTGPNMAGKSTFLRQNALIAILAQMGAFVPAVEAHIGVIDRLFSRVGAADDLARGRSTFMVEMVETAAILNQAGPRSFVILDEIGRGTATFDGLSIAWAVLEHLHDVNRARGLFASHHHELTALTQRLEALRAVTMRVKEWKGDIVFLHEVAPGAADRSYGIHVAKLAGIPPAVLARAETVLAALESQDHGRRATALVDDLPLFAATLSPKIAELPSPLVEVLKAVNPDELAPREALDLVYRLRSMLTD